MKLIYVVLASVALVSAETPDILNGLVNGTLQTVDIRKIVESWTPLISQYINENDLDPYALKSIQTEFWVPFPGIPIISYKAHFVLDSGKLRGLSKLKFNKATLTYENRIIELALDVEFQMLMIAYDYDLELRILHPRGQITADAKAVHISTIITFNTMDYSLALEKLQLETLNIGNVVVQNHSGWKYWVISFIAEVVATLNKGNITRSIETDVAEAIQKYLDGVNRYVPPEVVVKFFQDMLLKLELDN
ncbi:uncharacterized protein LOC116843709 [Odontomachus brunneus]|uniref:uncharacterized protein LOC116843709 n=1 Tax=Odontomachus brunneus TaxID=486640 RepID=UPI0013F20BB8|nr:uncharacterized protein LOC116843709 [Odontomachus brunneus]